jgi:ABC-type phosphate transport system auxiliary subunit
VVMLLAGITLVPAILAATGRKLFWPAKAWQHRDTHDSPATRIGAFVARRPGRVALISAGLLTAALQPWCEPTDVARVLLCLPTVQTVVEHESPCKARDSGL